MNRIKTGGRTTGTPNKVTGELREVLKHVIEDELTHVRDLLNKLPPQDRVGVLIKLLYLVLPRPVDESYTSFNIEQITGMEVR